MAIRFSIAATLCLAAFTACGEGELTPEEAAELEAEGHVLDESEAALFRPVGPPRPGQPGFDDGNLPQWPDDGETEPTPNEHPICPDCYVTTSSTSGYVTSVSPRLMTIRDSLPDTVTSIEFDKLQICSDLSCATVLRELDLGGFLPSRWRESQGVYFNGSSVSVASMTSAQRLSSRWPGYGARVKLKALTASSWFNFYVRIGVRMPSNGGYVIYAAP